MGLVIICENKLIARYDNWPSAIYVRKYSLFVSNDNHFRFYLSLSACVESPYLDRMLLVSSLILSAVVFWNMLGLYIK